jgi:membrane protease YdiL (CAAX protease family)
LPLIAIYLWFFWRQLSGASLTGAAAQERRESLRAKPLPALLWIWALIAGGLGIVALVLALRLANRLVVLPEQQLPDLSQVPKITTLSLLLAGAPIAGLIEEAAFRGYMQGPIEKRYGWPVAILITGTMFALSHLDFTWILWPYYVAVAAIYGAVTTLTQSILPAIVLHTCGNLYSNTDLWLHGRAEWQAPLGVARLVWQTGPDKAFWTSTLVLVAVLTAMSLALLQLARAGRNAAAKENPQP